MNNKCSRCGKCCTYQFPGEEIKTCKYLTGNKIKSCRIYKNRIGTEIAPGVFCMPRHNIIESRIIIDCTENIHNP